MADATAPAGSFTFVGNATALIRWGPFTLLTDPNFLHAGQRAYLGHGLSSRRLKDPALRVGDLPRDLDAIVLSHLHGDHWDRVARRGLDRALPILTTPHAARRLQGWHRFRRALGLRTWESHTLLKEQRTLRVTALPGMHAPGVVGRLLPPVMGSLLEFGDVHGTVHQRVYITGDTLMYDGVREIARRFPGIDLAVVHLGGTTLPGGLMVTMDGRQGAEVLAEVMPRQAVPVHFDDYDVFRSPLSDFRDQVERRGLGDRVTYVERGETVAFSGQPARPSPG
ncbi:MAG: MBL fold metallo-hydrolase [Actinomycetota bacterium]|nr:MBL fold metallo-hydrolase [Actinomycetota bacterium]